MITLLEINKAINDKIKQALIETEFDMVPIVAEDVSEPIIRPSIKVAIENSVNSRFNANCREKNLTCRVYFFAKDRHKYKLDNCKMQDIIENAFLDDLCVKDSFYISIIDVESEVSDTVLICSFNLYSVEEIDFSSSYDEPMEELNLEIEEVIR